MNRDMRAAILDRHRLLDVARLGLDREDIDFELQDVADAAASIAGTPVALVTALLDTAQGFLAAHGSLPDAAASACGTLIEWSFCSVMLAGRAPLVVPDLAADPRFRDNPFVVHEGVRAYVGVPLTTANGQIVGSLCVLDVEPRQFADDLVPVLCDLAAAAVTRLEAKADS